MEGIGKLIQMIIISATVGKNPFKEIDALIASKRVWNAVLGCSTHLHTHELIIWVLMSQKWQNDLGLFPRKTIQHHSNPVYAPTTKAKETEVEPSMKNYKVL